MIPSPVTPSPRQQPSDLRAGRSSFPPSSGSRGPPENGGPLFLSTTGGTKHAQPRRRHRPPPCEDAEAVCRHYLTNGRKTGPLLDRWRCAEYAGPQPLRSADRSELRPWCGWQVDRFRNRAAWRPSGPDRPEHGDHHAEGTRWTKRAGFSACRRRTGTASPIRQPLAAHPRQRGGSGPWASPCLAPWQNAISQGAASQGWAISTVSGFTRTASTGARIKR